MTDDILLSKKKSQRRQLFALHSWVGFHLAIIMSIVLATGTAATVSNEIDWMIHSELRASIGKAHVPWQTMTDAIAQYAPDSTVLSIEALAGDYLTHRARVIDDKGRRKYVYVDQWNGNVTGSTGLLTVQRFLRDLHRYLFMPAVIGLPIVTSMAFILAVSMYTGLKTSRNWLTLMSRVRVKKGPRVLIGDLHKAMGLWTIWFFIIVIVTSAWYLAEFGAAVSGVRLEPDRPTLSSQELASFGDVIKTPSTDAIIIAAKSAYPELNITSINFPTRVNQSITVLGTVNDSILRSRANRVFLNPQSLQPIEVQRSTDISWPAWLNELADPLHFGSFGGLITKLIWFFFGLLLTALSFTGVWLTWKRTKTASVSKAQYATMPVMVLSIVFGYFSWYQRYVPQLELNSEMAMAQLQDGDITVKPMLALSSHGQPLGPVRFLIDGDEGRPNLGNIFATLRLGNDVSTEQNPLKLARSSEISIANGIFTAEDIAKASAITLSLALNSGREIALTWPLNSSATGRSNISEKNAPLTLNLP